MPAYAIALVSPTNPDGFGQYREAAPAALAKHGGKVASVTPGPTKLEGDIDAPKSIALLEFPSQDAIKAWHSDPDLQDVHALRTGNANSTIFVLEPVQ